ncbi:MAG TPA: esterase-like activity of phytase family protein [Kaistia sp.]|nr:esterase-like activity of phytase family protein [Kaistia sp.]
MAPIEVHAEPIDAFRRFGPETRFGEFEFRGGLVLSSPMKRFGGLSGIDLRPNGVDFLAVSDLGQWFSGRLTRSAGRLTGVEATAWGTMRDTRGRPLLRRSRADAESVRFAPSGRGAYVTFEQSNDLRFYAFTADPSSAWAEIVPMPRAARGFVANQGLEMVAVGPPGGPLAGVPVLVSERSLDADGNHRAFVVRGKLAGAFSIVRSDDYDVTDGAFMPNGDLLLLERKVTVLPVGVNMRLRRIPGDAIRPGAVLDGPVALEAAMSEQIDNMEGLAVSTDPDGRTRVTIVSDNNLNAFQRTLLLEFVWIDPAIVAAQ